MITHLLRTKFRISESNGFFQTHISGFKTCAIQVYGKIGLPDQNMLEQHLKVTAINIRMTKVITEYKKVRVKNKAIKDSYIWVETNTPESKCTFEK